MSDPSRRPVDPREINQRLDELFDQKDPARHQRTRSTLRTIFRNGFDYSQGAPAPLVLQHIARRLDQWIVQFHDQHPEVRVEGQAFNEAIRKAGVWLGQTLTQDSPRKPR